MFTCQNPECGQLFSPIRKRRLQKFCPKCNERTNRSTADQYKSHGRNPESYIRWLHSKLADRIIRKKKSIQVNITVEELLKIFSTQDGKCALSGKAMTHSPAHDLYTNMSIDRIDANGDYVFSNVRFVIKFLNTLRNDLSDSQFQDIILELADAIKKRRGALKGQSALG